MIFEQIFFFSPGHPSGKDYINFEKRGNHFTQLVMNLDD